MSFALDPRLAADTLAIGDLALSRVLLMNDSRYPWLVLVPRGENLREIVDLDAAQLHVHVIGRAVGDPAWPGPVWGVGRAQRYAPERAAALIAQARAALVGS